MRVSSPIGELPFEATNLRYRNRAIELDGSMGAWPAHVVIELRDLPPMLRLVAKPLAAVAATTLVVGLAAHARRTS
jgi:hypothetical protein